MTDLPHSQCLDCAAVFATPGDRDAHQDEVYAAARREHPDRMAFQGHRVRVLNPTDAERARDIVADALDDALETILAEATAAGIDRRTVTRALDGYDLREVWSFTKASS